MLKLSVGLLSVIAPECLEVPGSGHDVTQLLGVHVGHFLLCEYLLFLPFFSFPSVSSPPILPPLQKQNKTNQTKKKNTGHLWHRAAEHVEECACALAAVLAQSFTCSGSLIHLCCVAAQFSAASPRLFCGRLLSPAVCANQPRGSSRVLRGAEQAEGRLP